MSLREDQELRREIMLRVLRICADPRRTLDIAARMERYVLQGQQTRAQTPTSLENLSSPEEFRKSYRPPRWTKGEDQDLRQLWRENASVLAAASTLNRTPASVYGRARRLGLLRDGRVDQFSKRKPQPKSSAWKLPVAVSCDTADNEHVGIESVIWFLRTRDYSVVQTGDGCYKLDEREKLSPEELFKRANRVREWLGRPTWASMVSIPGKIE